MWTRIVAVLALAALPAFAQSPDPDPDASPLWAKLRADLFADAPIAPADGVISLEAPARAQDASTVPVAIRAAFAQSPERSIERVWLVIDRNPAPLAAVFRFALASGRADIETRLRIEEYTHVRAIAATNDGRLYMATRYVKASGGCSAPPGVDRSAANASLGRMRLAVDEAAPGMPAAVRLQVSHPNDSGLAMDPLTRHYAPAHFVRTIEVRRGDALVMSADLDFAISENPWFRFYAASEPGAPLEARVVDTRELSFSERVSFRPAPR